MDRGAFTMRIYFNPYTGEISYGKVPPHWTTCAYLGDKKFTEEAFSAYCPKHEKYEVYFVPTWNHSTYIKYSDMRRLSWVNKWGCSTASILLDFIYLTFPETNNWRIFRNEIEYVDSVEKMVENYGEKFVESVITAVKVLKKLKYAKWHTARRKILNSIRSGSLEEFSAVVNQIALRYLTDD
jgi:hypothetical protein